MTADDVIRSVRERQTEFHDAEELFWTDYWRVEVNRRLPRNDDGPSNYTTVTGTRGGTIVIGSIEPGWADQIVKQMKEVGVVED